MVSVPPSQLETELSILKSKNLFYLIPNYLYTHFKDEFNDKILVNLVNKLTELSQMDSISEKIFSISVNLNEAFQRYHFQMNEILDSIEKERKFFTEIQEKHKLTSEQQAMFQQVLTNLATSDQIIFYQRSILIQSFNAKLYNLFSALFQKVFDIYHAANNQTSNEG